MKNKDLDNLLGCYFNQDFDLICGNYENGMKIIFDDYSLAKNKIWQGIIQEIDKIISVENPQDDYRSVLSDYGLQVSPKGLGFKTRLDFLLDLKSRIENHIAKM